MCHTSPLSRSMQHFSPSHRRGTLRPISLLTLSLLTLLDSNFPGKSLGIPMGLGFPPLKFKIVLESNPLKSTMLVGGLGVKGVPTVKSPNKHF